MLVAEMSLRSAFLVALSRKPVRQVFLRRFARQLEMEVQWRYRAWMRTDQTGPMFPVLGSIDRVRYVVRLAWRWLIKSDGGYFMRQTDEYGTERVRTWADFALELYKVVEKYELSANNEATYDRLAEMIVCVAFWEGEDTEVPMQSMENIARAFIPMFRSALDDPTRQPQLINMAMEVDAAGEGIAEHQPEAAELGEGIAEHQPEAAELGEGIAEHQPEAVQFGEGILEPQPEAVQFGEGILEPQPEAAELGEGILEHQPEAAELGEGISEHEPEAVQFGEGILEPQPEAEEIGEGILEPQPAAEEPATMTSVERSGARRRLTGVPMDTDAVRGVKRYRLRETYEREMARYKSARRRYDLRDTPTRQERLADMEQDLKRGRNVGSAQPRKRSRL